MSEQVDWGKIIAVTNRKLCAGNFLAQLAKVASRQPKAIVLREKDLSVEAYRELAQAAQQICRLRAVPLYLHGFSQATAALQATGLHLPLPQLRELSPKQRRGWRVLGASCHSVEDVQEAVAAGCTYIVAGHIYATDCKKGLPGRGLEFLRAACQAAGDLPVYAIGGITPVRLPEVLAAGAAGACVMSGMMEDSAWWR